MAKKQGDEAAGFVIIIAIILAPFIWLYNAVGAFWFWMIVIGVPILFLIGWFQSDKKSKSAATLKPRDYGINMDKSDVRRAEKQFIRHAEKQQQHANDPWLQHCMEIEDAWNRGDYDWARRQLQQIAYGMVGKSVSEEEKRNFTKLMSDFAKEDPLYNEVMGRLLPLVQDSPGMVQSQIYKGEADHVKEQMRYVLYFAHELGHIQRVKKGNSYKLYPPGMVIDSSAK